MNEPVEEKRQVIEPQQTAISIVRQRELVGLARSSYYYQAAGERVENLQLMRLLDEQYTRTPFYGIRRMTAWLETQGYYEEVYLKDYQTVPEAAHRLKRYFEFYNQERLHQALGYQTPAAVHWSK